MGESTTLDAIVTFLRGCRNDVDGIAAKQHVVGKHVAEQQVAGTRDGDYLDVMCQLAARQVVTITPEKLFKAITYRKPAAGAAGAAAGDASAEAKHPGFFVASVLASAPEGEMEAVVKEFLAGNPKANPIELVRYINAKGFVQYDRASVQKLVDWTPPAEDDSSKTAAWCESSPIEAQ